MPAHRIALPATRLTFVLRCLLLAGVMAPSRLPAADGIRYGRDIRPILSDRCFFCHGADPASRKGHLRLDIREEAIAAGALVPGKPETGSLIERINSSDGQDLMPPPASHKTLSSNEKQLLHEWIKAGAHYESHWAYTPPQREPGQTIDSLVASDLKQRNLHPSPPADPTTLLRRLHFDVTGLPPSPEEVAAFQDAHAKDPRAAISGVIEQLLASPHFGERMAVSWLDAVRYADSVGYHGDKERSASPFRDYVITAFNSDKPFDQFTIEQLAGDLLPDATLPQKTAASYNRLNQLSEEGGIQDAEYLAKYQAERVRTTSSAWLGSTMACCECHDHKFDPFTAKDFYSFAAYFSDILEKGAWNGDGRYQEDTAKWAKQGIAFDEFGPLLSVPTPAQQEQIAKIDGRIQELNSQAAPVPPEIAADLARLDAERNAVLKAAPTVPATISATPRPIRLLGRGDWQDQSGPVLTPATPAFLTTAPQQTPATETARPTRLDLAQWIASRDNPLTARVFVNRLWAGLFGVGLSKNTGDLGLQGEYPSHPELLDWLAIEFMENHWSVKHLLRVILLSATYQQSSTPAPGLFELDPMNRLLARQSQLRLPAELVRDNALAVSGLLNPAIGGPSAKPYQPAGYYRNLNFPVRSYQPDKGELLYRRGLYTHWQRTFLHPMLKAFDAPAREECATERPESNTPLQALDLLNDPTFTEAARALATLLLRENPDPADLVNRATARCLSRPPSAAEAAILTRFHHQELARFTADPAAAAQFLAIGESPLAPDIPPASLAAATSLARALLNLHETITRY